MAATSRELAARGVIVNTGSVAGLIGVKRRFAYCATKGAMVAMTRQEMAAMALYPCSEEATFVNGSVLTIDGGWTAA